jgi:hypothetical protein
VAFYEKYVARRALLDYIEMVCKQISKQYLTLPPWYEAPTPARPPPKLTKPETKCYEDKRSHVSKYCRRCQIDVDAELKKKEEEEEKEKANRSKKRSGKVSIREVMKKRARTQAEAKNKAGDKKGATK